MILYTYPRRDRALAERFPSWCPSMYPYTQSVSRVDSSLDPFEYTNLCEPISDIVDLPTNTKTWEEMCYDRAKDIIRSSDKNIYLYYSGGIDSVCVYLALREMLTAQDRERLHIVCTHHSHLEFPELWEEIYYNYKGRIINAYTNMEDLAENGIVLTGQCADQVLGSDNIRRVTSLYGYEGIKMPWKEALLPIYTQQFGSAKANKFIEVYGETVSACPFPIVTAFDWVWWFNFSNKWQHAKYKFLGYKPWKNPKETYKNVVHFFDTPEWQKWSLDNHDKKIGDRLITYKFIAKDFIVGLTGFERYTEKKKVSSLRVLWYNKDFSYGVSDGFEDMSRSECLELIRREDV